jgi:hypothetical protein
MTLAPHLLLFLSLSGVSVTVSFSKEVKCRTECFVLSENACA